MTRRLLVALLMVLGGVWVLPAPAYACSCAQATDAEHVQRAEVVFTGAVTANTVDDKTQIRTLTFRVDRVYKGTATATQVVTTAQFGASCGLELTGEGPFLVFADQEGTGLTANSCGGTRVGSAPASLGAGQPPAGGPSSAARPDAAPPANRGTWVPLVALILAASAAAVVGLSLIRRPR